jgi:hypothetical protein
LGSKRYLLTPLSPSQTPELYGDFIRVFERGESLERGLRPLSLKLPSPAHKYYVIR